MFELFEHKADIGVRGFGTTLEEAFEECAKAMFSVMVELESVNARESVQVNASARNESELLLKWLNELLYKASVKEMIFCEFKARIKKENKEFKLEGTARGEKINPKKHRLKTEVKGVSYSGLKVKKEKGKFLAQCIVDV